MNPNVKSEWYVLSSGPHEIVITKNKPVIALGSTVKLKSGGPVMTVNYLHGTSGMIDCRWFSGLEVKTSTFHRDGLVLV